MNTPEKCPKCGAKVIPCEWNLYIFKFECGSILDLDRNVWSEESDECIRLQRDQLATKITALKSTYAECSEKLYRAEQREHDLKRRFDVVVFERNTLADHVIEMEVWKESTLAVEHEWDPSQLATMLGGKLGESQRAVIQREVPRLLERVKRLESAGEKMAAYEQGTTLGDEWRAAKSQP